MDLLCGDNNPCCPKCTKPASFQHVIDLDSVGITIMQYVADLFHRVPTLEELSSVRNIHDHDKNNIFIIINNNGKGSNIKDIRSDDIQPNFDINKLSCRRCRYRAEKALSLLKSNTNLGIDDIKGICDHCKAKLSQKPCAICEETVKKFLEETNAQEITNKSIWYKQRVTHIHRPLSLDRSTKKIDLDTDRPKSGVDPFLDLKLAIKTKTELYKPLLVPTKHQVTLKKPRIDESSRVTPKIKEFPSDESVITSFVTTFSKTNKDQKEKSFRYIFPEEKVETHKSKAVEITSSELIKMTQDKVRQQTETQGEIGKGKYDEYYDQKPSEKYQEIKAKTSEIEPVLYKVKAREEEDIKSDSQYVKGKMSGKGEVKPQASGIKPTRSVMESEKREIRPRSAEVKTTKSEKESGKREIRPRTSKIKTAKSQKDQQDTKQDSGGKNEGEKKPTPQDINPKTSKQKEEKPIDQGKKKSLQDNKVEKTKQGEEKTVEKVKSKAPSQDVKTEKSKQGDEKTVEKVKGKSPLPDIKPKKGKQGEEKLVSREDKIEEQQEKPKKVEKKAKKEDKVNRKMEPSKEKPELQEVKKVTRMGEKKLPPPPKMPPKPTLKDTKDTKSIESIEKSPTKIKKDVKPPKVEKKPKKDDKIIPPTDSKVDEVPVKSKAAQVREPENRRKEKKLKREEQQQKTQDDTKQETPEVKKEDDSKKTKETEKGKEKKKDVKDKEKDKTASGESPKKDNLFDILKILPPKRTEVVIKYVDPLAAIKLAEQRMKDLESVGLAAARVAAEKKSGLQEIPKGQYFLFQIKVRGVPEMGEEKKKRLKDLHLSNVQMKTMKMRGPSYDDLILKMVKLGKKAERGKKSRKIIRQERGKYKIRSAKRTLSIWSLSIDSEVELEIDRLAHIVKVQHIRHKIKGKEIVENVCDKQKPKLQPEPIIFYKNHEQEPLLQIYDIEGKTQEKPEMTSKGIVRYSLSDPTYIEKGWTVLPTMKVVRKMNIYKMKPAYPEFDWFKYNKNRGYLTYESGEKLAEFDENGRGRWYYKNGRIALDYYDAEDIHAQQRFVLYSSGEEEQCRSTTTVLGLFDYLGNGVVFDHSGKIRVKYNQSEGVLLDSGIGPTSHWKWHTLNDPPVLKQVMINTFSENPYPELLKYDDEDMQRPDKTDEEMLAIEIDNILKEKTKMQKQQFKPFQIKMKALKINKQLSLKILDQAHVYLYFRDGTTSLKLNLGMVLDNTEIIDSDTTDVGDVSNVLEKFPPQTESIVDLQEKLEKIRRCDRERTQHAMRVRTILPVSSADKLIQARSKPKRPVLPDACAPPEDVPYTHRKPSQINLYYNTRLI